MWRDRIKSSESKTWKELLEILLVAMRKTNNSDAAECIKKEMTKCNITTSQLNMQE